MEVLGDMWVKMRGECSSSTVAVVSSAASGKTTTPDDQSPWLFVALYKRRLELVKLSVLIGLHPDLNPSVTPEVLTEMFELWTRCKLARKRQSDALRSIVVSAYVYLYWAVMYQLGGQPAPLIDAEVCFDPAVSHYSSINLSGFLPALIEPSARTTWIWRSRCGRRGLWPLPHIHKTLAFARRTWTS
ncbi:hypothetical protein PC116_g12297 [Phytophthora cactorum]|nr:hypothetical protein PC116_g12297 [Phytophthora cactorum]